MNAPDFTRLPAVLEALSIRKVPESWAAAWDGVQARLSTDRLGFLEDAYIEATARTLRMGPDVVEALRPAAREIRDDEALRRLAWYAHHELFVRTEGARARAKDWPNLAEPADLSAPPGRDLFWAVVLLSGVPRVLNTHLSKGIDPAVTIDTLGDLELWMREGRRLHGRWCFRQQGWLRHHFTCELFKLGRLQFEFSVFDQPFRAFRNRRSKRVVVLADDGARFRADGQFFDANGREDAQAWTACFEAGANVIRGHRISARGEAQRAPGAWPAAEWEAILAPGDTALGTHIAATGPMGFDECGASYRQALEFFPKFFPHFKNHAFTCYSWLLDPQFETHLKPDANIVRFLREFHLTPMPGATDAQHFERVFDGPVRDLDAAPQTSSLQRAMIAHARAGGCWRMTGSLLFPEDLAWGRQVYRTMEAEGQAG